MSFVDSSDDANNEQDNGGSDRSARWTDEEMPE